MENRYRYNMPFPAKEKLKILLLLARYGIDFLARRYHVTERTIYRWKSLYDGTVSSLENKSHKPHTPHPNAHTDEEIKHITDLLRRNPDIGLNELYGKLRLYYAYARHPLGLYNFLRKRGYYINHKPVKKYVPKLYHTPQRLGEKWQCDVKVVPKECYAEGAFFDCKFYQYTMLDEASRERFLYIYPEQSGYSSRDFLIRSINYFRYKPKTVQTDNGAEFTNIAQTNRVHAFDAACVKFGIEHKKIRPRTPRHNGKVERSHRSDSERFYNAMKFFSYDDLQKQASAYLKRSNDIPMSVLIPRGGKKREWLTPKQKRAELLFLDHGITE